MTDSIRVRMYRVGFGDCFLITIPGQTGAQHLLIDCGVHARGDIGTLTDVMANVEQTSSGKLALIVATHMHQDHIAGFDRFRQRFSALHPSEVWLPWTEDPNDATARQLRGRQTALAEKLLAHFAAAGGASLAASDAAANLVGNANAIDALNTGFGVAAQVRYLHAGLSFKDAVGVQGLSVDVLGPPQDQQFLGLMDPPAGQRFLRAGPNGSEETDALQPFAARWRRDENAPELRGLRFGAPQMAEINKNLGDTSLEGLAFALDQVMNNTSVVLLLTFGGRSLLFAGDAQYGNWRWWLDNMDSKGILSRISFLKVAHHGSVNATPVDAVQRLGDHASAMVSTQNVPWDSIPRLPLLAQLQTATANRLVRSDSLALSTHPDAPKGPPVTTLPPGFAQGALWFDYTVDL